MLLLMVESRSWMHDIPVPLKLLLLSVATLVMLPVTNPWVALAAAGLVITLYLSGGRSFARIGLVRIKPLIWLLIIIFSYLLISGHIDQAFAISFKLLATVGLANLVTMTSRLDDMMSVVERLSKPLYRLGLPPRALGLATGLVIRFTPVFLQKGRLLNEAWRARSAKKAGPRLIIPLALEALDDAELVAEALRARGGIGSPHLKDR